MSRKPSISPPASEKGAALLIVLLLVASLSVIAVAIVQTVTHAYRTSGLSTARSQTLWFAVGVEDYATTKLEQALELTEGRVTRATPSFDEVITIPLEGGTIRLQLSDRSNCFNLNSLALSDEELTAADAVNPRAYFEALLGALEFEPGAIREIVDAASDWVDSDTRPRTRGAETSFYAGRDLPHAAGDTLMATPQELLAVRAMTPDRYRRLRRYVCTLPDTRIGTFNVNTLTAEDAPLLVPVFQNLIPLERLAGQLADSQSSIYDSPGDFLADPLFAVIAPEQRLDQLLGVESNLFRLSAEVVYLDTVSSYEAVFQRSDAGQIALLRRRLGVDE